MKILLGDINANSTEKKYFKMTIGNEILHETNSDSRVRVVKFSTSNNLSRVQCSYIVISINTRTSCEGKTHNQTDLLLIYRRQNSSVLDA
jgi:hypothetical protein